MLIQFAFSNFKSVRSRQQLSLVASAAHKDDLRNTISTPLADRSELVRAAAVYGANASGKTNILKALDYMTFVVLNSQRAWKPEQRTGRQPFMLDETSAGRETEFEIDLLLGDVRYTYGFALDDKAITREHLYAYPRGRPQVWFERASDIHSGIRFGKQLTGENRTIWSLTRPNSLFLSAAAQNNHRLLAPVYGWFARELQFAHTYNRDERIQATVQLAEDPANKRLLLQLLASADLGIVGLEVKEEPLPAEFPKFLAALRTALPDLPAEVFKESKSSKEAQLLHKSSNKPSGTPIEFEAESDGTKSLFGLASAVVGTLACGGVLCVDELEASLHPALALEVVRFFSDPVRNPNNAQLVFTTHSPALLGAGVLRRDQIWFTEKDDEGATRMYPLTDFRPRKSENLETGYLQGRYGAIPFVGDMRAVAVLAADQVECGDK